MGILDTINHYVDKACETFGIKKTKDDKKRVPKTSSQSKPSAPVITQSNVPQPVDSFSKSKKTNSKSANTKNTKTNKRIKSKSKSKSKPNQTLNAVKTSIKAACAKNCIDYDLLMTTTAKMAGMTIQDFNKLPESKQTLILGYMGTSIQKAENYKKKYGRSKDINITEAVLVDIKIAMNAMQQGIIEKYGKTDDINKEMLNGINDLSEEEMIARLDKVEQAINELKTEAMKEINKAPKSQRAAKRAEIEAAIDNYKQQLLAEIFMVADDDKAEIATTIVAEKDFAEANEDFLKTRKDPHAVANRHRLDAQEKIAKRYYEKGEPLSKQTIQSYNVSYLSRMDAENAERLQAEYVDARKKFESGEHRPEYLNNEYFTATATGIGIGVSVNEYMSVDERAVFMHNWDLDAQQFSDYNEVIQGVQEGVQAYIQEHASDRPELAHEIEKIQEKVQNLSGKGKITSSQSKHNTDSDKQSQTTNTAESSEKYTTFARTTNPQSQTTINKGNLQTTKKETDTETIQQSKKIQNAKPEVIEFAIRNFGLAQATKTYEEKDIVSIILKCNLKEHFHFVKNYIKKCDDNALSEIIAGCSTEGYLFVLRNVSPLTASKLYDGKKDMCYAARKLGENIIEESLDKDEINRKNYV